MQPSNPRDQVIKVTSGDDEAIKVLFWAGSSDQRPIWPIKNLDPVCKRCHGQCISDYPLSIKINAVSRVLVMQFRAWARARARARAG